MSKKIRKAVLTVEIESTLNLADLKEIAQKALTLFDVNAKGTYKVVQIQANRIK
ncbi:MAG: hypothetical protein IPJ03_17410 [Ignavibacteriales bacterium]|nr:hypothetical protein [Ignavibacteriales bacterium]